MNVVTVNEAKRNLDSLIAKVVSDAEPTIITTETGQQIVLLSLDEFNQMWDKQIEEDLQAGRLDALLAEVDREYEAGLAAA